MAAENDWKKRLGVVYSTGDNFNYDKGESEEAETLPPQKQKLIISLDKKQRKGKTVSLITGFVGKSEDLEELGKELKKKCGTGGSAKDGEIIIQGDFRTRLSEILVKDGYTIKLR
ncbi:MAG: translation initiation factor [Bacteroidales bacterium]|nr:translation initiation factor [Bacteroidales bacterium]MCF8391466.1 translation initiation factor [Bacteroidales bacterium]